VIAYSGDTEWTDALIEVGQNADIVVAEAYFYEKKARLHLDYATLLENFPAISPKHLVLTHMSDMLKRLEEIPHDYAEDGKVLEIWPFKTGSLWDIEPLIRRSKNVVGSVVREV